MTCTALAPYSPPAFHAQEQENRLHIDPSMRLIIVISLSDILIARPLIELILLYIAEITLNYFPRKLETYRIQLWEIDEHSIQTANKLEKDLNGTLMELNDPCFPSEESSSLESHSEEVSNLLEQLTMKQVGYERRQAEFQRTGSKPRGFNLEQQMWLARTVPYDSRIH
jgi:hypothetical protein